MYDIAVTIFNSTMQLMNYLTCLAPYRQKLEEVNESKESELTALRQHISAVEGQLATSNIVSFLLVC